MKKKKTRGLFGTNKRKPKSKTPRYIEEYEEYDEYQESDETYEEYEEYEEADEFESAYEDIEEAEYEQEGSESDTVYESKEAYYEDDESDSDEEYTDEEYDDEEYDDEEYDDEEYYDDEYYDEEYYDEEYYEEYDEEYERPRGLLGWIRSLTAFDIILFVMGIVLLTAGGVVASIWFESRMVEQQIEAIVQLGEELSNVGFIGQDGIESLEQILMEQGTSGTEEVTNEIQTTETKDVSANTSAKVNVTFTSAERDLKICFTDAATGKLITGTVFEVVLTNTRGKSFTVLDKDMDGVIYATNVNAGNFQAVVTSTEKFRFPTTGQTVVVNDKVEYVVINVQDEIKTESQVNVAVEDTENLDAKEEEVILKDTVEWIESGKQLVSGTGIYSLIDKKTIPDPTLKASASVDRLSVGALAATLNQSALNLFIGEEFILEGTTYQNTQEGNVSYEYLTEWKSSNQDVATVENGKVTAKSLGNATISYVVTRKTITTVEPEVEESETEVIESEGTAQTSEQETEGETVSESQTQQESSEGAGEQTEVSSEAETEDETTAESMQTTEVPEMSDEQALEATVDRLSKEAVQTIETIETVTATCDVKVSSKEASDIETLLKDKSGNQVFIKDSKGNYIEAVYADYYTQKEFYIKIEAKYYYTGWQTINGKTYFYDKTGKPVVGAQIIQGVSYHFGADGAIQNNINGTAFGIDVSKHNGKIDWNAVKSSGVDFAIIRCGYRGSSSGVMIEDPKFHENIKGATAAGIKVGIYFFSQAVDEVEAVKEASMAVSLAKSYHLTYPIFIDTESSGGRGDKVSIETRTAVINAFCKTVQDAGYQAGVYSSKTWYEKYINMSQVGNYKIWLAHYADVPNYAGRFDMWQYSCKGTISGINGKVDLNYSYLGY